MSEYLIVLFILFIGSLIQGTSGFGFGLLSMGLLPLFIPLKESTLLVVFFSSVMSIAIIRKQYQYIQWSTMSIVLSSALIGRVFSFFFLNAFGDLIILKQALGFLLISMVLYLIISKSLKQNPKFISNPFFIILISLIGGFIGGVFAVGGPFYVSYFLMHSKDKRNYIANLQTTFLFTNSFTFILHGLNGDLPSSYYLYAFLGSLVVLFGAKLGQRWFYRLPNELIYKLASVLIFFSGINLIFL